MVEETEYEDGSLDVAACREDGIRSEASWTIFDRIHGSTVPPKASHLML
jgi:hypothetical protein